MPSLFSRQRTTSTPNRKLVSSSSLNHRDSGADEFGRVPAGSRTSLAAGTAGTPVKKNKSKKHDTEVSDAPPLSEGGFLPYSPAPTPAPTSPGEGQGPQLPTQDYGHLSYQKDVILGLDEVHRLVQVVSGEIEGRCLQTPFLFSTLAIDLSSGATRRLIESFLRTCGTAPGPATEAAESKFAEDAKFAGPHELAMLLRWGLARILRLVEGAEMKGILDWEMYLRWREDEAASEYPPIYIQAFFQTLPLLPSSILTTLLNLMARLTTYSTSSGLTPTMLSTLFAPLLFHIPTQTFEACYASYLATSHATEHLLLAYIRLQDHSTIGTPTSLPTKLKSWIRGYPSMLPPMEGLNVPRRGAKLIKVTTVRRNVRLYSADLVRSASNWANKASEFASSREWNKISPRAGANAGLPPRYTDSYRKRMDLPASFFPGSYPLPSPYSTPTPSLDGHHTTSPLGNSSSSTLTNSAASSSTIVDDEEERFRSLTDLKWGAFEARGFGGFGGVAEDRKALDFDLNESARKGQLDKRRTLTWADFSNSGFTKSDAPLSATLQFSAPLESSIQSWPSHSSELQRKLKKTHKALPAFGWDTSPVMGIEQVVEEGFLSVFCDLIYGGGIGWMDRPELSFRESNWALVELKSFPSSSSSSPSPNTPTGPSTPRPGGSPNAKLTAANDPRHSSILFLFEEFVPLEYRTQLASAALSKKLPIRFFPSVSRSKAWKPAQTLNGQPYVIGQVGGGSLGTPKKDEKEREFEKFLGLGETIKLSAGKKSMIHSPISPLSDRTMSGIPGTSQSSRAGTPLVGPGKKTNKVGTVSSSSPLYAEPGEAFPRRMERAPSTPALALSSLRLSSSAQDRSTPSKGTPSSTPSKRGLFSRLGTSSSKRQAYMPSEYDALEFETRLTGSMDEEDRPPVPEKDRGDIRRMSRDDSWVDILVSSNSRMGDQDAELPPSMGSVSRRHITRPGGGIHLSPGSGGPGGRRSDPELASQEVARTLAAAGPPPPDLDFNRNSGYLDSPTPVRRVRSSGNAGEILEPIASQAHFDRQMYDHDQEYDEGTEEGASAEYGYGYDEGDRTTGEGEYDEDGDEIQESYFPPSSGPAINVQTPTLPPSTPKAHRMQSLGEDDFPEPPPIRGEDIPRSSSPLSVPLALSAKPPSKVTLGGKGSVPGKSGKGVGSLVEMYAEKDAMAQSSSRSPSTSPQAQSRLPVRIDSKSPQSPLPPIPVPSQSPSHPIPVPSLSDALLDDPALQTVPMPMDPHLGRSSPGRYVHGAPLHNVDEAEEED